MRPEAAGRVFRVIISATDPNRSSIGQHLENANMRTVILFVMFTLAACADAPMVQISPDTYMIARSDKGGIFGNAAAMKVEVIQEANTFAASQGKVAIPISTKEVPVAPGRLATIEYQFRLVDHSSPEAKSTAIKSQPDEIIERRNEYSGDVTVRHESDDKPDLYSELTKLEDLRQKGILTDEEFEAQKKKLLEAN